MPLPGSRAQSAKWLTSCAWERASRRVCEPIAFDDATNQEALAFAMVEDYLRPLLPHALLAQLQPYFRVARTRVASGHGSRGRRDGSARSASCNQRKR